jgi:hypothetical protein
VHACLWLCLCCSVHVSWPIALPLTTPYHAPSPRRAAARNFNNIEDGFYISPAFLDKISIHVSKNFLDLPKIKIPLILGIWGGKGQGELTRVAGFLRVRCEGEGGEGPAAWLEGQEGAVGAGMVAVWCMGSVHYHLWLHADELPLVTAHRCKLGRGSRATGHCQQQCCATSPLTLLLPPSFSPFLLSGKTFQCNLAYKKLGIAPIVMSAGELESGNAGEPAKLIRQRYREASDVVKKGKMCSLFINDLDAGAGRMGDATQYTVNNQVRHSSG